MGAAQGEDGTTPGTEIVNILALDISKRSTGWAWFAEGADRARHGVWDRLGSEYTSRGQLFYAFYGQLLDHRRAMPFERVAAEEPVNLIPNSVQTNAESVWIAVGMGATLELFCHSFKVRLEWVHQATWRRHFLGRMPRATKSASLKALAMERARQLGFSPHRHDEAEALGILDHALERLRIPVPWRAEEVLRPPLGDVA